MRVAKTIKLDENTERELRVLAKRWRVEVRVQQRALVVLLAAPGAAEQGHRCRGQPEPLSDINVGLATSRQA
jgi:hypothetical protein